MILSSYLFMLPLVIVAAAFAFAVGFLGLAAMREVGRKLRDRGEAFRASEIARLVRAQERAERTGMQLAQEAERHAPGSVMRQHYTNHALEALARAHELNEAVEALG